MKVFKEDVIRVINGMNLKNTEVRDEDNGGIIVKQYDNAEKQGYRIVSLYFCENEVAASVYDYRSPSVKYPRALKTMYGIRNYIIKFLVVGEEGESFADVTPEAKSYTKKEMKDTVFAIAEENIRWMEDNMPLSLVKEYHDRTEGQLCLVHLFGAITKEEYTELSRRLSNASNLRQYGFNEETLKEVK